MAIPAPDRPLRVIQLLTLFPTLALTTATSVTLQHPYFATITIPMFFSLLHALALLHPSAKPGRWTTFLDMALACTLFGMLIPYWVGLTDGWGYSWRHSAYIVGTFGSCFPLVNLCIHTFFALREVLPLLVLYFGASGVRMTCPHCLRELQGMTADPRLLWDLTPGPSGSASTHSHDTKVKYEGVPGAAAAGEMVEVEEGTTPRASIDDETARLV